VSDPEGDSLTMRWQVFPEMRTDGKIEDTATPLEPIPGLVALVHGKRAIIQTPDKPGRYRVFVWVFDGHGSVATANVPFYVEGKGATPLTYSAATTSD
jgi:hypothetical protein